MLLLLTLGCAHSVPPTAPEPVDELVPTELCEATGPVPTWTNRTPAGAEIGDKAIHVPFPDGLTVDAAATGPHRVTLVGPPGPGAATVLELLLVPTCEIRLFRPVFDRLARRSVAHLGDTPTMLLGDAGLGDGFYALADVTVGETVAPVWSAFVVAAGNEHFEFAVAATCARGEGSSGTCGPLVDALVRDVRAQIHHAP